MLAEICVSEVSPSRLYIEQKLTGIKDELLSKSLMPEKHRECLTAVDVDAQSLGWVNMVREEKQKSRKREDIARCP